MKSNQKAFSVVEILIVLVVIGLLGAVGWLVYDRQKSPKQSETTQQSSSSQEKTATTDNAKPKETEQSQQKYLEIKEWGVKLPLNSGVSLSYTLKGNTGKIRSTELDKLSGSCTSNSVNVVRGKASEIVPNETGEGGSTFLEVYNGTTIDSANLTTRSIKAKAGDYYYVVPGYTYASCIDIPYEKPEGKAKQEAETKAMLDIVKAINQLVQL